MAKESEERRLENFRAGAERERVHFWGLGEDEGPAFDDPLINQAFAMAKGMAANEVLYEIEAALSVIESPIEKALFAAMIPLCRQMSSANELPWMGMSDRDSFFRPRKGFCMERFAIRPQAPIGRYRADFLLSFHTVFPSGAPLWIPGGTWREAYMVVECDGHDFHEKTKDQARRDKERDRNLQAVGFPVFHFTGSEVWADPFKCARTALDVLVKAADDSVPKREEPEP